MFDNIAFQRNAGVRPATFADSVPSYVPPDRRKRDRPRWSPGSVARGPRACRASGRLIEALGASSVTAMFRADRRVPCCAVDDGADCTPVPPAKSVAKASNLSRFSAPALMVSSPAGADRLVICPVAVIDVSSALISTFIAAPRLVPRSKPQCLHAGSASRSRFRRRSGRFRRWRDLDGCAARVVARAGARAGCGAAEGRQRQLDARLGQPHRPGRCGARGARGNWSRREGFRPGRGGWPIVTCSRSMATVGKMDAPMPPIATGWPIAFDILRRDRRPHRVGGDVYRAQTARPMTSRMRTAAAAASAFLTMEASAADPERVGLPPEPRRFAQS